MRCSMFDSPLKATLNQLSVNARVAEEVASYPAELQDLLGDVSAESHPLPFPGSSEPAPAAGPVGNEEEKEEEEEEEAAPETVRDLPAALELLRRRESDLALAAQIGQALLREVNDHRSAAAARRAEDLQNEASRAKDLDRLAQLRLAAQ